MKYDDKGNLIPDAAETYSINSDGTIYEVVLKKNIKWHDNKSLTADDIIFTIGLIKNIDYKSPLRINWIGVNVEKIDDYNIRFKLINPYAPFIHNLTFGILPKHIWKDISAANFSLSPQNLKPTGSGPYKFKKIIKDNKNTVIKSLTLESNKNYYLNKPFIKKLEFKFYKDESAAFDALNKSEIDGLGFSQIKSLPKIKYQNLVKIYSFNLPRYFAIFLNSDNNKILTDKNIRIALNYATDKKSLLEKILNNRGVIVESPILPDIFGYEQTTIKYNFDLERAKSLLEKGGWTDKDNDGIREKEYAIDKKNTETIKLEITLSTTQRPELSEIADLIKEQWKTAGVQVNINIKESAELQQNFIKPRHYQALLFGEVLGLDPDPFAFWHSSQKKDPGLNLSLFDNAEADKLLEEARQEINPDIRRQKYVKFQNLVIEDAPVIFLYSPLYFYAVTKNTKGIEEALIATPTGRFNQIENWYIKTKRVWK